ncbi:hypothetical protein IQ255_05895 [Pleurocapsales cyanobacterium LEGE 10410]|nr:hypothetical protein [Pleurocapsales cyanobacterium LEGE 10410]
MFDRQERSPKVSICFCICAIPEWSSSKDKQVCSSSKYAQSCLVIVARIGSKSNFELADAGDSYVCDATFNQIVLKLFRAIANTV